jgi:hypothetical protein
MKFTTALLLGLLVGCSEARLPPLTPADRVKYTVEALEAACGAYLSSPEPREPNLDELCKTVVKPPAVSQAPAADAGGRVASDTGGREG